MIEQLINKAVAQFGSQKKLASAMGCCQQQISYMKTSSSVSAEMAMKIERATQGEVAKHELRPDLFEQPELAESKGAA